MARETSSGCGSKNVATSNFKLYSEDRFFFSLSVASFPASIAYSMLPGMRAENSEGKNHSEILLQRCYFYNLWDCG